MVLEKGDKLRATGATIGIYTNGWKALDQLGVGKQLREKAVMIDLWVYHSLYTLRISYIICSYTLTLN